MTSFEYLFQQVDFLILENISVLSAPVKAWNAGKALALHPEFSILVPLPKSQMQQQAPTHLCQGKMSCASEGLQREARTAWWIRKVSASSWLLSTVHCQVQLIVYSLCPAADAWQAWGSLCCIQWSLMPDTPSDQSLCGHKKVNSLLERSWCLCHSVASGILKLAPVWKTLGADLAFTGADNTGIFSRIGKSTWWWCPQGSEDASSNQWCDRGSTIYSS